MIKYLVVFAIMLPTPSYAGDDLLKSLMNGDGLYGSVATAPVSSGHAKAVTAAGGTGAQPRVVTADGVYTPDGLTPEQWEGTTVYACYGTECRPVCYGYCPGNYDETSPTVEDTTPIPAPPDPSEEPAQ